MKYKAIQEIGGYRIGDEVPAEKAEVWMNMYVKSPVEKIEDGVNENSVPEEIKPSVVLEEEKEIEESSDNPMSDDYLNRNTKVVKKSIERDDFNYKQLNELLKLEKSNKNRSQIIKAIEDKQKKIGE